MPVVERYAIIIHQPHATPEYPYDVQIITNGFYCGYGRFCKSHGEAVEWIDNNFGRIEIKEIDHA